MGIRKAFSVNWEQAVMRFALLDGVEILPEQRTILRTTSVYGYPVAEFCMLYGDSDYPKLISTRFTPDVMLISAYIHVLEQRKRLKEAGIISKVVFQKGLLQCIYIKEDFAKSLQ